MEISVNNKPQDASSKVSARRRLIRGAFATPAVFTLCSGSALAKSSTAMRCITNANKVPTPAPLVSASTDTWVRVQLVRETAAPNKYFVLGSRLPVLRASGLPSGSQWQEFDVTSNKLIGSPSSAPVSSSYADVAQYAALRIDASGTVVGVGNTDNNGSAIRGTCWASFITAV